MINHKPPRTARTCLLNTFASHPMRPLPKPTIHATFGPIPTVVDDQVVGAAVQLQVVTVQPATQSLSNTVRAIRQEIR
jgi:hypothetical protein